MVGVFGPQFLEYATYQQTQARRTDAKDVDHSESWSSQTLALLFLVANYSLGLVFVSLPEIYLARLQGNFAQLCPRSSKDEAASIVFDQTANTVMVCVIGLLLITAPFGVSRSDLWLHAKALNSYLLCTIVAISALLQFPFALVSFTLAFIQSFLTPLVPHVWNKDFELRAFVISAARSLIWLVISGGTVFLFYFGSIIHDPDFTAQIKGSLVQFMLDYECMGSRVWPFLMAVVLPNLVLIVKIITN